MPLVLTRIDDRLIHGQVVVGWGTYLKPNRIILCNDGIATTDWQREMYSMAGTLATYNVEISIWTVADTMAYFRKDLFQREKVFLLIETPEEVYNIIEKGIEIPTINIGGMHFRQGKRQLAPYIFVDDLDIKYFKQIKEKNIQLQGQDVPTSKKINVAALVDFV